MRYRVKSVTTLYLLCFVGLCVVFYLALIHATNQYKDKPIRISQVGHVDSADRHLKKPSELDILYERCMQWAAQSRSRKLSTLLQNPVYERLKITEKYTKNGETIKIRKKKVDLLVIVSSGPRRGDRRQAIRDTWWKDCKPTSQVRMKL